MNAIAQALLPRALPHVDRVVLLLIFAVAALAIVDWNQRPDSLLFTGEALIGIAPFIALSVTFAAFAGASNFDGQIARAFSGRKMSSLI